VLILNGVSEKAIVSLTIYRQLKLDISQMNFSKTLMNFKKEDSGT